MLGMLYTWRMSEYRAEAIEVIRIMAPKIQQLVYGFTGDELLDELPSSLSAHLFPGDFEIGRAIAPRFQRFMRKSEVYRDMEDLLFNYSFVSNSTDFNIFTDTLLSHAIDDLGYLELSSEMVGETVLLTNILMPSYQQKAEKEAFNCARLLANAISITRHQSEVISCMEDNYEERWPFKLRLPLENAISLLTMLSTIFEQDIL
jgi:hypothetical protein